MSDTGLFAGLYSQIRVFAELFDEVLLDAKLGHGSPTNRAFQTLGHILVAAGGISNPEARTKFLGAVLRESPGDAAMLTELGRSLLGGHLGSEQVATLETLAQRLEHERAGMLGKMRGRGC